MKKKIFFTISFLIIALFIISVLMIKDSNLEKAITISNPQQLNIIHEEKTDKGSIVFYNYSNDDSLSTCFITKDIFGYKNVYSSIQEEISLVSNTFGLTYLFMPAVEKTSLPIYCGVIGNPYITQVKIIEMKRNIEEQAKIINVKDKNMRLWLVYMNKFKGSDFEIIGLSSDGKELSRIIDNISPYFVEQKPFKTTLK